MSDINWQQKRMVFVNREFSIALVRVSHSTYMELDDYREDGGNTVTLPPYSEYFGSFTNAEISTMDYPQ